MRRDSLLIFLERTDVPADNNACERALRPSVVHRKVMGSFRSAWGAQTYAALATVLNTAKRNGENAFQKSVGCSQTRRKLGKSSIQRGNGLYYTFFGNLARYKCMSDPANKNKS